jgi:Xaa-Pro dipeptidase
VVYAHEINIDSFRENGIKVYELSSPDLKTAIDQRRVYKDDWEISAIKCANKISSKAHETVMSRISKLKSERDVEAIFLQQCVSHGAKSQAYAIIAAAGENASTLHYDRNNEELAGRELICLDAGCEVSCYASDVTRTFPISGKFSQNAGAIYEIVLKMQTKCIEAIKPGVMYRDLHIMAHKIAIQGLMSIGILQNGTAEELYDSGVSMAFFPHGLGHHVGLEVHDVSGNARLLTSSEGMDCPVIPTSLSTTPKNWFWQLVNSSEPLMERMVVTIEPGMWVKISSSNT